MEQLNCLIIDDVEIDRILVEEYVKSSPQLNCVGCFGSAIDCLETVGKMDIQLLFLDIDMPVLSGLDFLKGLKNPPVSILITAHADYAPEAFDVQAIDFLVKPVKKERFDAAVKRAVELLEIRKKALLYDVEVARDVLTIKEGHSINKVLVNDIVYLEALTNYTRIYTVDGKLIVLKNLKNLLSELPEEKFLRVHRSFAVAKNKIRRLENSDITVGEFTVPLGKTYRTQISAVLQKA